MSRNGVLIFVAPRAQKFAVIGDSEIHEHCGDQFWQELVELECTSISKPKISPTQLCTGIDRAGELLAQHFPRRSDDTNRLTDAVEEG